MPGKKLKDETARRIVEMRRKGSTYKEIEEVLNVSSGCIRDYLQKAGMVKMRKSTLPDEVLGEMYHLRQQGWSYAALARKYDVRSDIIRKRLYREQREMEKILREYQEQIGYVGPDDPRSRVCQQIKVCCHDRCYLHTRCPAYAAYLRKGKEVA